MKLRELDVRCERRGVQGVETPGAKLEDRGGARRHGEPERLLRTELRDEAGEELRDEDVARADGGDRLDVRRERTEPVRLSAETEECEAAILERDEDVSCAHLPDRV